MHLRFTPQAASPSDRAARAVAAPVLALAMGLVLAVPTLAVAQLSSPLGEGAVATPQAGSGAGVHSPNSPFAPLQDRADVLPWSVLTAIKTKVEKNRVLPVFPASVQALNQKSQRIQGFMMPLEPGEKQVSWKVSG